MGIVLAKECEFHIKMSIFLPISYCFAKRMRIWHENNIFVRDFCPNLFLFNEFGKNGFQWQI